MFPVEVIRVDIKPITFNDSQIKEVFIDLEHINKGKEKKTERSALSLQDVLKFVFLLNELSLEPDMMRGNYVYYISKALSDDILPRPYNEMARNHYSS